MADVLTKKQRSYNMAMIRSRDTQPEIILRTLFKKEGLKGYKTHSKPIP